jgi:hypothetical protein
MKERLEIYYTLKAHCGYTYTFDMRRQLLWNTIFLWLGEMGVPYTCSANNTQVEFLLMNPKVYRAPGRAEA